MKALFPGLALGLALIWGAKSGLGLAEALAMLVLSAGTSSFLGMHFTGSTPYTSPSGVEKEMKLALPLQGAAFLAAIALWTGSAFV